MRQLHFLRSVMGDQKKSSGNKFCVSYLLYYVSVQHLLFFLSVLQEKTCYVALFRQGPCFAAL